MRRCRFCGTELSEQARFCGNCGNPVSTLPDMQSDVGRPPAVDVQSRDTPTFISDASWPTVISERPLREVDTPWWGFPDDQDVQIRQLPDDRQIEESQSLAIDPFFPGVPSALNSPPGLDPFLWTHRVWTVISIVAHKQLDGESFGIVLVVEETSSR
jgi:hypothetical protein